MDRRAGVCGDQQYHSILPHSRLADALMTGFGIYSLSPGTIGYHYIYHLNARIPFYRLPEVLRAIPELQAPKTTSLDRVEVRRCLRLKVWDVEAQRRVGMPQAGKTVARGFATVG